MYSEVEMLQIMERRWREVISLLGATFGVLITVQMLQAGTQWFTRAQEMRPDHIRISNVDSRSFTVGFTTAREALAFISYGTEPDALTQSWGGKAAQRGKVHHISIPSLEEETTYYWEIRVGEHVYNNSGQPFETTTGPELTVGGEPAEVFGKAAVAENSPAGKLIVYGRLFDKDLNGTPGESSWVSTEAAPDGEYVLNLSRSRTKNFRDYYQFSAAEDGVEITVQGADGVGGTLRTEFKNAAPLPNMTVSSVTGVLELAPQGEKDKDQPTKTTDQEEVDSQEAAQVAAGDDGTATPQATDKNWGLMMLVTIGVGALVVIMFGGVLWLVI